MANQSTARVMRSFPAWPQRVRRVSMTEVPQDLSDLLVRAIIERRGELDGVGRNSGDHAIEISFHYHPGMGKIDMAVRTTQHLPSVRAPRRRAPRTDDEAGANGVAGA